MRRKILILGNGFDLAHALDSRVIQHDPLVFHDYNCMYINAFCVVSDSGTLPEESLFFTSIGHLIPAMCVSAPARCARKLLTKAVSF